MPGPARAGVLIYAKNLPALSAFYAQLLGARVIHADDDHHVLQTADAQLIIHAIPAQFSRDIVIQAPPAAREEQAIKPFFTVASLAEAERVAEHCGGRAWGPPWAEPDMRFRNFCDAEGNIINLREQG